MKAFTLIISFSIMIAFSHATPTLVTLLRSQTNQSSTFNLIKQQINENKLMGMRTCPYKITIKTSCSSPIYSKDVIGLLFGDANGEEITVVSVGRPETEILERCMMLTYDVLGSCIGKICKLYVARVGSDGWVPETITAYHNNYPPAIFNYDYFIPEGKRYGFNYCHQ
ncbi:unnamed protein product [Lathyrus oleraceus]|uniref:Embryo-specific 3 n=2 Tax=Pisum sativum TaxID=3888 RepID=A0A9D4X4J8_PEA|nr:hypothetical protein KIW84_058287 [Pisum sativum]